MKLLSTKLWAITVGIFGLLSCVAYRTQKGNTCYSNLAYSKSINYYEKVFRKTFDSKIAIKLADSYVKIGKADSAESVLLTTLERSAIDTEFYLDYARVLILRGKQRLASIYLRKYLEFNKHDLIAQSLLNSCNSLKEHFKDTTLFVLKMIRENKFVNCFGAIENGNEIIFTADKKVDRNKHKNPWTGNSYLDLYSIHREADGSWSKPELLKGTINGEYHDGPITLSKDGKTMFLTRSNYTKRKMLVNEAHENTLKICRAILINNQWEIIEEFNLNNENYSIGHPSLSIDGKTLYYVSDMPGGYGGKDIYKATLQADNCWGNAENLGASINTSGDELFPYINDDGTLYFSSTMHNNLGGLDVFSSKLIGGKWTEPENLNYPLNSSEDDFGFTMNGDHKSGFIASSRASSDKIYAFDMIPPTFNLYGLVREKGSKIPLEDVSVELKDAHTGEIIIAVTDHHGSFRERIKPESKIALNCKSIGCYSETDTVSTVGKKYSEDFFAYFEVEPLVIEKPVVLKNIYFDFDKWNIRLDAGLELDKLVELLNQRHEIEIEMGSHADVRGSDEYNQKLSEKRAKSTVDYLILKGIDRTRLSYKGYGEKVLVNHCTNGVHCSEKEHQENRRTEFKVLRFRE